MNTSALVQKVWNFCHTLRAAFVVQLVPQDHASVLLERIRAEHAAHDGVNKPRARKAKESRQ